jgi:class 3 adenylate cyclase/tetratricopeptide (TPR) repeat protein
MDVGAWLKSLGLECYEATFRENAVNAEVLPRLTAEDLKEMGVVPIGHRRRLLDAIATLHSQTTSAETFVQGSPSPTDPTRPPGASETTAERRPLSVMFCDLAGSTALSSQLDPEDLREVIRSYQARVASTIRQFNGFIARYVGDGVLIYFGWPEAHETDAARAVQAALAVAAAVSETQVGGESLQVRISIATGLVVIGEPIGSGDARQQTAIGETPNRAARLQNFAGPGQVIIDAVTRRQIGGLFDYRDLGTIELKGLPEAVPAWQVVAENRALGQFEALRSGLTPLVGREEELELLLRRWTQAKGGSGKVVLVSAEPGVGKSRLGEALAKRIAAEPHIRLRYFCSPHHQDSALYPVITQIERAAGFAHGDAPEVRLAKLQVLLAATEPPNEDVALIAQLHGLSSAGLTPLQDLTPQRRKAKTFEALLRQLEALARQQPVLMVFDDIHWIDPSSRELLGRLIERVVDWPVLLLALFRPEFQPPWVGQPQVTLLTLARLDRRETAAMVASVADDAGNAALPPETVAEIVERTDGVPLFVEELTRAVLEAGTVSRTATTLRAAPSPTAVIPATLHVSLIARLDRLSPAARDIARKGAAIGREFPYELIKKIVDYPETALREALDQLTSANLLFLHGMEPQAIYMFKHALIQDVAYSTLLRAARQQAHALIAAALADRSDDINAIAPELFAFHYERAGNINQAFRYWILAGDTSEQRGASLEAIAHYRAARKLTETPEASHETRLCGPEIGIKLGNALMQVEGYNSEPARKAFEWAQSAAARLELPELYARAAIDVAPLHFGQCRYHEVLRIGKAIAANQLTQLRLYTQVHLWIFLAVASYCTGQFTAALDYVARAISLDNEVKCGPENPVAGGDPAVVGRSYAGLITTALGDFKSSLIWSEEGWMIARSGGHAYSIAWAALTRIRSLFPLGRYAESMRISAEFINICERHGFTARLGSMLVYRGAVRAATGDGEGLPDMRRGIALWQQTSLGLHTTQYMCELVSCLLQFNQATEADNVLQSVEEIISNTEERSHVSEVNRLRGRLYELRRDDQNASTYYHHALEWSRRQQARLFELRAAINLAQLWRKQGKRAEARDLLAPIYSWFTEGFDAPDLKEARALLDELA